MNDERDRRQQFHSKNIVRRGHTQDGVCLKSQNHGKDSFLFYTLSAVTCVLSGLLSVMSKRCNCALLFLFVYGKTKKYLNKNINIYIILYTRTTVYNIHTFVIMAHYVQ